MAAIDSLECGVDLIEINRFTTLDPAIRRRFIKRVFTPAEIELCGDRDQHLAGRFAVKEAVAKALGTGIGPISWQEIETLADENQAPILHLYGQARLTADELKLTLWSVSITHTRELAMAFVVAAGEPK
jgi:holo-[acyl-carrier protein] synthase